MKPRSSVRANFSLLGKMCGTRTTFSVCREWWINGRVFGSAAKFTQIDMHLEAVYNLFVMISR